ncbi:hypothetical protein [Actinocatenispora rupis]|uniref:hypothetical protein n=1 Tax=Actinocatenispora rupis TaxID=519421 RepID=UPI001944C204|nr:hypothetical protein [Actinocatenispora rupis]
MAGVVLAGVAALALVSGCGPDKSAAGKASHTSGSPSPGVSSTPSGGTTGSPSPSRTLPVPHRSGTRSTSVPAITLQITGGFAGKNDTVSVAPDGAWRATDGKRGVTRRGTLTPAQHDQLVRLVSGPELAKEAKLKQPKLMCNDGLSYRLTVGTVVLSRTDCGGSTHTPTFDAVVKLVTGAATK